MAQARQTIVLNKAKAQKDSTDWSPSTQRTSADGKTTFYAGEPKCNLFVYEMLVASGVSQDLPNGPGLRNYLLNLFNSNERPYVCEQWYNEEVPNMKLVGKGIEGLNRCWPGDIVTDGHHIGIISGPQKTIHASGTQCKVIENNWGWDKDRRNIVKIFRYHP